MRYLKECKQCKRKFRTTRKDKVYCSRKCFSAGASESYVKKRNTQGQLCWRCKNCCGGCSWSRKLMPIEGWTAKKTKTEGGSYRISKCPQFIEG